MKKKTQTKPTTVLREATDYHGLKWLSQYGQMWASGERFTKRFGVIPAGRTLRHEQDIMW